MSFALCWLHHRIITIPTITTTPTTTTTTAVSSVTDMEFMFYKASAFNQPLSTWDGKCRWCLFIAHDESKLFYCRLTYVCRLLFVLVASSNHHHSYDHDDDHHYHYRSVERNDYGPYVRFRIGVQSAPINLGW